MTFQVGSVLLDACVLASVDAGDAYGYSLTQSLKNVINVSESTLYPVLRRLQSDNLLSTYDQPFQGRNRRYYSITEPGRAKLTDYENEWKIFKRKVDRFLDGESKKEGANGE